MTLLLFIFLLMANKFMAPTNYALNAAMFLHFTVFKKIIWGNISLKLEM